ncbi:glycosyltransferase family 2 protein [Microbacterium sp. cf332]|uniref:glycosyltransferase family 2 protein n=1 Tax=Microbacterium sp. cf332 TaxID=1761804 RepID=UPI000884E9B7|nr:glycosyltransferase family 2 protein [Microbacterium sp. cf332]SDQ22985.1 Glycosyl transferase family 2 [Microbacterium sp. cf332]
MTLELRPPLRRQTVSVVIPVKDDAVMLRRCLDALAAQSEPADEVVVVDNASCDDSAEIARASGARVVACATAGIPAAAATGYDHATGELVLRLDADSLPGPTWIADLRRDFARRPDVAVLTGGARFVDGPRVLRAPLAATYLGLYALLGFAALGHLPLFGSNLAFRRTAWRSVSAEVHRADAHVHDDFDLAFHLGAQHRIGYARRAGMGISMRPFDDRRSFRTRVARGFHTVVSHWPDELPHRRLARRLRRGLRPLPDGPEPAAAERLP